MWGMRLLPASTMIAALLCVSCAGPVRMDTDGWGVERRMQGRQPALLSISTINAGSALAKDAITRVPVRARERGRLRIAISADTSLVQAWTPGAALFDPQLDRALDRLAALGGRESRRTELRLTLMPERGARRLEALHAATDVLVIDLLFPVPAQPRSRSAVLDAALATGLHEAAHALRPAGARDRADDEYRASLVAACFRIDSAQRGDSISFSPRQVAAPKDFALAHSATEAQGVQHDLAGALGKSTLEGSDRHGIAVLQAFCRQRLAQPPR